MPTVFLNIFLVRKICESETKVSSGETIFLGTLTFEDAYLRLAFWYLEAIEDVTIYSLKSLAPLEEKVETSLQMARSKTM